MESGRRHRKRVCAVTLVLLLISCSGVRAVDFASGTGERNDPYQIATAEQLIGMADDPNLYDKDFVLVADIDLDPSLPGRQIFRRSVVYWVGSRTRTSVQGGRFLGDFDGNGYTIYNCQIYGTSNSYYMGLFDKIGTSARIHDLHLENVLIADGSDSGVYCGALVGGNSGLVARCTVTGTILARSAAQSRAGLVGYNAGTVVDCHAQCYVFGEQVGGLIGINEKAGRIVFSSANGTVLGDQNAGGLVCTNEGTIQYSLAEGSAFGSRAGGLVCDNRGTVRESYAAAIASWAGLVGANSGTVLNCYAKGTVPSGTAGGLVGSNEGVIVSSYCVTVPDVPGVEPQPLPLAGTSASAGDVRQCYYLVTEKPVAVGRAHGRSARTDGARLAEEMQQRASLPGLDFHGDPNDGLEDHWFMPEQGYPILTWQADLSGVAGIPDVSGLTPERAQDLLLWTGFAPGMIGYRHAGPQVVCNQWGSDCKWVSTEGQTLYTDPGHYASFGDRVDIVVSLGPYDFDENPGDGSEANPYRIETAGQLDTLLNREDLWASHFVLMANVDLTYHQTYPGALIGRFSGTFDGGGHTLRYAGGNGLFGTIEAGAVVRNLILEYACVSPELEADRIGLLAGTNKGQIVDCAAAGQVFGGRYYVGGLAGWNEGQISRCAIDFRVFGGTSDIGGLVGHNVGEVVDCCVRGLVRPEAGGYAVGGLIGGNAGHVAGCGAPEIHVSASGYAGGLVGNNEGTGAWIENCYARGNVKGAAYVGGLAGASYGRAPEGVTVSDPAALILNCYTTCSVIAGEEYVGGCVGEWRGASLQEGCYFLDPSDGGGPDNGYGVPLFADQMRRQASFVDWDFQTVWTICEGTDYPRLQWEEIVCEESVNAGR